MKHAVIRYTVRPEFRRENEDKVRAVFRELHTARPEGLGYMVLASDAGEFVHVAASQAHSAGLIGLHAFQAFQEGHARRREGEISRSDFVLVGEYWPRSRG